MTRNQHITALAITADGGDYRPHEVRLNGQLIGYRPWDGSDSRDVIAEVVSGLAGLLGERFGWPQTEDLEDL